MLTTDDLIEIDNILKACGELSTTNTEERWLTYKNESAPEEFDYYRIAQMIIIKRDKARTRHSASLELVIDLAAAKGHKLTQVTPEKRETTPVLMCGGLRR